MIQMTSDVVAAGPVEDDSRVSAELDKGVGVETVTRTMLDVIGIVMVTERGRPLKCAARTQIIKGQAMYV